MKIHGIFTASIVSFVLLTLSACSNDFECTSDENSIQKNVIYCRHLMSEPSRTTMRDEVLGDIVWNELDAINVFTADDRLCGSKYVTKEGGSVAKFEGETSGVIFDGGLAAIYPYSEDNRFDGSNYSSYLLSGQIGIKSNFDPRALMSAGQSASTNAQEIGFYNICGGIRFSVKNSGIKKVVFKGNNNESLAGKISISFENGIPIAKINSEEGEKAITLTIEDGIECGDGNYYYITMIPQTLSKGFTFEFYTSESEHITTSCDASVTINRGVFSTVHLADDQNSVDKIINSEDLSIKGTANCYIINKAGAYRFKTSYGTTDRLLSDVHEAELLWETDNTESNVKEGSLINLCFYGNNYVYFKTPAELAEGNALIAVKDISGEILWSWHIWICKDYDADATAQKYKDNSSYFMDRNLGALSAGNNELANGLFYQWGRKDPFPGAAASAKNTIMATTGNIKSVMVGEMTGNVNYSVKNPTTFILSEEIPYDWVYSARDNNLWQRTKTIYDPCPYGWKVPYTRSGETGDWSGTDESCCRFETRTPGLSIQLDSEYGYAFYPANGYLRSYDGKMEIHNVGKNGRYWSCATDSQTAAVFEIIMADGPLDQSFNFAKTGVKRFEGHSIRCVKD